MFFARRRRPWELPGSRVTEEAVYLGRRQLLAAMGLGGAAAAGLAFGGRRLVERRLAREHGSMPALDAAANPRFLDAGRALSAAHDVTTYANFYEFGADKRAVPWRARDYAVEPYGLRIGGLVREPAVWTLEDVEALGLEERVYRHRCVEAWAMTVPWIGVPLHRLLEAAQPLPGARFLALESHFDPECMGQDPEQSYVPFPFHEALRLDEAMCDLAFVAVGLYGRRLTPQNGTPLRVVLPWKYGYKGPKSVVRLTLVQGCPPSLWGSLFPDEYSWEGNVDPRVPHPRWSQATERLLGTGEVVPTLPFNGYDVGSLYTT